MTGFALVLLYTRVFCWFGVFLVSEDTWHMSGVVHVYQEVVILVSFFLT